MEKNFNIIKPLDLINNSFSLPENSCLLTFDDGLKDHIKYVLPELNKRKIKGCFFPPGAPIEESRALNVHLIHFILEKTKNKKNFTGFVYSGISIINSALLSNNFRNYNNFEKEFYPRIIKKYKSNYINTKIVMHCFYLGLVYYFVLLFYTCFFFICN